MTFAMAAWQAWLLVVAGAAAAAALFLLKVRPPRVRVPSLLFWSTVLRERRELTLWERIRRAVSLAVTVAIAAALALGFARPSRRPAAAGGGGRTLVALDSSWSMLARTRSGETRWERAVAEARRLAAGAAPGAEVALATTGEGLLEAPTSDVTILDAALDRATPSGAGAGWPHLPGATVHLITDGATPRPIPSGVVVHSVYEAADNAGITAFDVRPPLDGTREDEAFLEVANFAPAQPVHLTITRGAAIVLDRRLDIGTGQSLRQIVRLPRGGASDVRVRIEAPRDALSLDNEAFAWIADAKPLSVAVVGPQTAWLAPWFRANPEVTGTFATPDGYRAGSEDVVIFDRYAPSAAPAKPAMYIAPPAVAALGISGTRLEAKPKWIATEPHPLLDGVDPLTFSIERARSETSPQLRPIAQSAAGTPLVSVGAAADRPRVVVLSFGPNDSNLAEAPAFPVLMGNAVDWLARASAGGSRRTGRATFNASIVRVKAPAGDAVPLLNLRGEPAAMLRTPGIYTAEASGGAAARFAVNVVDPDVSNLARTTLPPGGAGAIAVTAGVAGRPWWMYLVVLAFAALTIEWWTWLRRITV